MKTIVTNNSLTAIVGVNTYTMTRGSAGFDEALNAIRENDEQAFLSVADIKSTIQRESAGRLALINGGVFFNGNAVHNVVVDRIVQFSREGLPYEPLMLFLGKLLKNPQRESVDMLYKFLENENLPITEEGNFLAYKGVGDRFEATVHKDKKGNEVFWKVGATVKMPRSEVTFDPQQHCGPGLHVGSLNYARGYGSIRLIVEVDPANVVSVPADTSEKMRVCEARVLSICEKDLPVTTPLATKAGKEYFKIRLGRLYKVMGAVYRLVAIEKTTGKHILRHHLSKIVRVNRKALKKASIEQVRKYLAKKPAKTVRKLVARSGN